jgi:hypothetical protein
MMVLYGIVLLPYRELVFIEHCRLLLITRVVAGKEKPEVAMTSGENDASKANY